MSSTELVYPDFARCAKEAEKNWRMQLNPLARDAFFHNQVRIRWYTWRYLFGKEDNETNVFLENRELRDCKLSPIVEPNMSYKSYERRRRGCPLPRYLWRRRR